jgi:uncharacterized protein
VLRAETGQPGQIEGTFTRLHAELGISVVDVLEHVRTKLGVNAVHLPVNVMGSSSADSFAVRPEDMEWVAACYADAARKTLDSLLHDPVSNICLLTAAVDLIDGLLKPGPPAPFICPAGNGTIAVDSNGDVYPCFMFYRVGAYKLGSVLDTSAAVVADAPQYAFLGRLEPSKIPTLSSSWATRFLNGCAGGNYLKSGDHGHVSDNEIRIVESMAGAAIVELAHLRLDEDLWAYLPHSLRLYKLYTALEQE